MCQLLISHWVYESILIVFFRNCQIDLFLMSFLCFSLGSIFLYISGHIWIWRVGRGVSFSLEALCIFISVRETSFLLRNSVRGPSVSSETCFGTGVR